MKEFILIIDDDKDICKLLGIYLGNEGYRYLACENARKAMDVLEHYQVDLILLDVMMPGIDGISACLKIRETNKMPIIFMSAKSEDMDIIQGLTAGGDDAYCKSAQQIELGRCASRFYQNMLGKGVSDMADWRIIPGYILINSIVIAGTILVFFLVYRRLSVSFRKRLTAYFLRAACHSLVISLIVLAVEYLLFYYGLREFFYHLSLQHGAAAEYLHTVLTTAPPLVCFVLSFSVRINRKVKYVEYLSQEIQLIREEGFGRTMELQDSDEITELCASINEMSVQLSEKQELEKKQLQSKNELITNVSHDLRSPLTSIIGYVDLLKQTGPQDQQRFAEYIEVVERRLTGLNVLINELFEYTKLNSAEKIPDMEQMDVIGLLRHVLYEHKVLMEANGLTLSWQIKTESYTANINTHQMVRVFQNLLDNARRYADKSAPVTVTAETDPTGQLHICIANQAADTSGLNPDQMFERLYRGDQARNDTQSAGLGLAIAKRIVQLHGGRISASLSGQNLSIHLFLK